MKLPKEISPCPIIDTVIEIRFESTMPKEAKEAIFGIIFNEFNDRYPSLEKLPILQIPEAIREADPNFKYQAYHKLSNDDFILRIGPNVISLGSSLTEGREYIGWEKFLTEIEYILSKIEELKFIKKFERLGIRYINYFNDDIFNNIAIGLFSGDKPLESKSAIIGIEVEKNDFTNQIQITNKAKGNIGGRELSGSIIDIDTYIEIINEISFKEIIQLIKDGHQVEKELFFGTLETDFISTLNPKY